MVEDIEPSGDHFLTMQVCVRPEEATQIPMSVRIVHDDRSGPK